MRDAEDPLEQELRTLFSGAHAPAAQVEEDPLEEELRRLFGPKIKRVPPTIVGGLARGALGVVQGAAETGEVLGIPRMGDAARWLGQQRERAGAAPVSLFEKTVEGVGSGLGFLGATALGTAGLVGLGASAPVAAPLMAGTSGVLATVGPRYKEALASFEDPESEEAQDAALLAALLGVIEGASEAVPIAGQARRVLGLADKASGRMLSRFIRTAALEAGEEVLQENFQQVLADVTARYISRHDQARKPLEELMQRWASGEALVVPAVAGGLLSALASTAEVGGGTVPQHEAEGRSVPELRADAEGRRRVLPSVSEREDKGLEEGTPVSGRDAPEGDRAQLLARLRAQGLGEEAALRRVQELEGRGTPRGLFAAAEGDVAVPDASPGSAPDDIPYVAPASAGGRRAAATFLGRQGRTGAVVEPRSAAQARVAERARRLGAEAVFVEYTDEPTEEEEGDRGAAPAGYVAEQRALVFDVAAADKVLERRLLLHEAYHHLAQVVREDMAGDTAVDTANQLAVDLKEVDPEGFAATELDVRERYKAQGLSPERQAEEAVSNYLEERGGLLFEGERFRKAAERPGLLRRMIDALIRMVRRAGVHLETSTEKALRELRDELAETDQEIVIEPARIPEIARLVQQAFATIEGYRRPSRRPAAAAIAAGPAAPAGTSAAWPEEGRRIPVRGELPRRQRAVEPSQRAVPAAREAQRGIPQPTWIPSQQALTGPQAKRVRQKRGKLEAEIRALRGRSGAEARVRVLERRLAKLPKPPRLEVTRRIQPSRMELELEGLEARPRRVGFRQRGKKKRERLAAAPPKERKPRKLDLRAVELRARRTLVKLLAAARRREPSFGRSIRAVAKAVGSHHKPLLPGVKSMARALVKALHDYQGDATRVRDILRGTVVVDTLEQAEAAVVELRRRFGEPVKFRDFTAPIVTTGYRDILMHFDLGALHAEVQINVPRMIEAKERLHLEYEEMQRLQRARGPRTGEQQRRIDQLEAKQRAVYDSAWNAASRAMALGTMARKAASEIGTPSLSTVVQGKRRPSGTSKAVQTSPGVATTGTSLQSQKVVPAGKESGSGIVGGRLPLKGSRIQPGQELEILVRSGEASTVELAEGRTLPVTYAIVAASELVPSHDVRRGFVRNPAGDLNERPYDDPVEGAPMRETVRAIANAPKVSLLTTDTPSPVDGPPIVTSKGVVLGGNARTMGMQLAYSRAGPQAEEIRAGMVKAAKRFGIEPLGIADPVLVRIVEPGREGAPGELSRVLNESLTTGKGATTEAVSRGSKITAEVASSIAGVIGEGTLRDALGDAGKARDIARTMVRAGALGQRDMAELFDPRRGIPTQSGKQVIEDALLGSVIGDVRTLVETPPATRNVLLRALPALVTLKARAPGFADTMLHVAQGAAEVVQTNQPLADVLRQAVMPGIDVGWKSDATAVAILRSVLKEKPTRVAARLEGLAARARDLAGGQASFIAEENLPIEQQIANEFSEGGGAPVLFSLGRGWRRNFTAAAGLPEGPFASKIRRDGWINAHMRRAEEIEHDLVAALRATFGKKLTPAQVALVDDALKDPTARGALPVKLGNAVQAARNHIKELSQRLISSGVVDQRLVPVITKNLELYATRSYRAFDDPQWAEKVPVQARNAAKAFIAQEYSRREFQAGRLLGALSGLEAALEAVSKPTKKDLARLGSTQRRMARVQREIGVLQARQQPRALEAVIERLLFEGKAADGPVRVMAQAKLGTKDLSFMKRRKNVPVEIRALWGEYKDARVNYMRSVSKMAFTIGNHEFLAAVRADGLGRYLWEGDDPAIPPEAKARIAGEASAVYAPLNGLYTTPEIRDAFKQMEPASLDTAWRWWVAINGIAKYSKTVLSVMTTVRNNLGNTGFALAQGYFRAGKFAPALKGMAAEFHALSRPAWRAYLRRAVELGVIHESPHGQELRALLEDVHVADASMFDPDSAKAKGVRALHFFSRVYGAQDDFWKLFAWENEKAAYRKAEPRLSADELERKTAEIVRNVFPTYSMVPRAVRQLRQFPLVGTFVSFPWEVMRTAKNTIMQIRSELGSQTSGVRVIGARRLAGTFLAAGWTAGLAALARYLVGMTDDDDEAARKFLPPWSRDSDLLWLAENSEGARTYVDISYLDPHSYLKKPLMAFLRGDDWEDAARRGAANVLAPFFSEEIATKAVIDALWYNRDEFDNQIYDPEDSTLAQTRDVLAHLGKAVEPGTATSLRRIARGLQGEVTQYGRVYDPGVETLAMLSGVRMSSVDTRQALHQLAREFARQSADATSILSRVAGKRGRVSDEDLVEAYGATERARSRLWEDFQAALSAARGLGLTDSEIMRSLRGALSADTIAQVIRNRYEPYRPSGSFLGPQLRSSESEHARELLRRISAIRRLSADTTARGTVSVP